MDKQQCAAGCGRSVGTGIASGLCVYCSVNRQIRNEADELTAASTHYACREIAEKLAAAEARIAELEEAFTWSMHNWGNSDAAHSFSLFVLDRGGDGDLGDCFAYWKSTRRAAALLKEKE